MKKQKVGERYESSHDISSKFVTSIIY